MMTKNVSACACLLFPLLVACSSDDPAAPPTVDGGMDATADTEGPRPPEAGRDAPPGPRPDAGPDGAADASSDALPDGPKPSGKPVKVFFSSDLSSTSGKCHRDDNRGCNLFVVDFSPGSRQFANLTQLTSATSTREFFPTVSPDGRHVVYEVNDPTTTDQPDLMSLNLSTGSSTLLVKGGRFPDFAHDGTKVAYSDPDNGRSDRQIRYVPVSEKAGALAAGAPVLITSALVGSGVKATDPQFFPDGKRLTLTLTDANDANHVIDTQMSVVDLDGSNLLRAAPPEMKGCGHTAVSPDGNTIICGLSSSGATYKRVWQGGAWGPHTLIHKTLTKANFVPYDSAYSNPNCTTILLSYQEFCGSGSRLAVTVQCTDRAATVLHARVYLLEVGLESEFPEIIDLSSEVEKLAGVTGKTMMTTACLEAPGSP